MSEKPLEARVRLNTVWMKAAILGGLWASIEIIIGSFFHNLRLPFSGTLLAANSTLLMVAFYQMWPEKGLIWRAGLLAALMKSISPSAVIFGPMMGILSEALIMEFFIRFFGNNLVSLSIGGALSVSSALFHKVISLLLLYGFNIVKLYLEIFNYLAKQVRIENPDPWLLVIIASAGYLTLGLTAAGFGYRIGKQTLRIKAAAEPSKLRVGHGRDFLEGKSGQIYSGILLFFHACFIPAGFVLLHFARPVIGIGAVLAYLLFCIAYYGRSLRRLKKLTFWVQLVILTFLAALFWNGIHSGGWVFNREGLIIGLEMNLRAIFVVVGFTSLGIELRSPTVKALMVGKRFENIYAALQLSFSALPVMIEAMPKPLEFFRHPSRSFSGMMVNAREWLKEVDTDH